MDYPVSRREARRTRSARSGKSRCSLPFPYEPRWRRSRRCSPAPTGTASADAGAARRRVPSADPRMDRDLLVLQAAGVPISLVQ